MALENYFGIDIGGTNVRIGLVHPFTGQILGQTPVSRDWKILRDEKSAQAFLLEEIKDQEVDPKKTGVAISSAGIADEERLEIRGSPNLPFKKTLTFPKVLADLGFSVSLANDVLAQACGISTFEFDGGDVYVMNLGTGYNEAEIFAGKIKRMEAGHLKRAITDIVPWNFINCNCGTARDHLELSLGGIGAKKMAQAFLTQYKDYPRIRDHPLILMNIPSSDRTSPERIRKKMGEAISLITAPQVYDLYEKSPDQEPQRSIVRLQIRALAERFGAIRSQNIDLDKVVLTGGVAKNRWNSMVVPAIKMYRDNLEEYQHPQLKPIEVVLTDLPQPALQGAVAYMTRFKSK